MGQTGKEEREARLWGMLCHLTALSMYVGVPFGNIIGPLVIWLIKREEHPFVNDQGRESLNFQISITVYLIASGVLAFVLIGIPLLIALAILNPVLVVIASIRANNGEPYRYPLTIQFIK